MNLQRSTAKNADNGMLESQALKPKSDTVKKLRGYLYILAV